MLYPNFCRRLANDSEKLLYAAPMAMALCSYGDFYQTIPGKWSLQRCVAAWRVTQN